MRATTSRNRIGAWCELLFVGALLGAGTFSPPAYAGPKAPYEVNEPVPQPRIFAEGVISTRDDEAGGTFSPDGREFYFSKLMQYTTSPRLGVLCVSRFRGGHWTKPEVLPFSGKYVDLPPYLSPDGKTMYFASSRPAPGSTRPLPRIWRVERAGEGWGEPQVLPAPINAPEGSRNLGASVTSEGTLYFSSDRGDEPGHQHIYRSRQAGGVYQEPEKLGPAVNSPYVDYQPFISPDEKTLVFNSIGDDEPQLGRRPEILVGGGHLYVRGDLYVSVNRNGQWTPARHLGHEINTEAQEGYPVITPDGRYLFFASERSPFTVPAEHRWKYADLERQMHSVLNGHGNIFFVDMSSLELEK